MAILEAELAAAGESSDNFSSFQVAFGLFGLTSLTGIGIYARSIMLNIAGNRIVERMKKQLFASIMTQEMTFSETGKNQPVIYYHDYQMIHILSNQLLRLKQ